MNVLTPSIDSRTTTPFTSTIESPGSRSVGADFVVPSYSANGPCGTHHLYGDDPGHVGEVVYIGTHWDSPEIDDFGHPHAELVDVKPGVQDVTIEYCTDAGGSGRYVLPRHPETSETGIKFSGQDCTLRWSIIEGGHGAGVEVGTQGLTEGEAPDALADTGTGKAIYENRIRGNVGPAIRYPEDNKPPAHPRSGTVRTNRAGHHLRQQRGQQRRGHAQHQLPTGRAGRRRNRT